MKKVHGANASGMYNNAEMLMSETLDSRLNHYMVKIISISVLESKFKFEAYYHYFIILQEKNNVKYKVQ